MADPPDREGLYSLFRWPHNKFESHQAANMVRHDRLDAQALDRHQFLASKAYDKPIMTLRGEPGV